MRLRFEAGGVVAAAVGLETEADAARRLASECGALGGVAVDTLDGTLGEGLRVVGDVCGDVLEVAGLDLDVLAANARAGVRAYDAVERAVIRAAETRRRAR